MAWTMGSAEFGLVRKIEKSKNSATAVVAGSAITLSALVSNVGTDDADYVIDQ